MGTISGKFKDINNKDVEVVITSEKISSDITIGSDDNANIFFSGESPVVITTNCEDMFVHIIKKTACVSLVSKIYLGDMIFAGNVNDVSVKIYQNGNNVFDGYVEANSYNQPWSHPLETIEINCIDKLSLLQYQYITDGRSYNSWVTDSNIYSFEKIMEFIGLNKYNVMYDNSKKCDDNKDVFTKAGVSINLFLGDAEDKLMSNEEILNSILTYLNLHIIQEGNDFYIFDWQSLISNNCTWTALFGNIKNKTLSNITVNKDMYSDDGTSLSMDEAYNQISLTCKLEQPSSMISSFLDTGDLEHIFNGNPQLYMTELWTTYDQGHGSDSASKERFRTLMRSERLINPNGLSSGLFEDRWYTQDWYLSWLTNPKWSLMYNDTDVDSFVQYNNENPIHQADIMKLLYQNKFMPALVSLRTQNSPSKFNSEQRTSITDATNYLVISTCAGWSVKNSSYGGGQFESQEELIQAMDAARIRAAGTEGMLVYKDTTAVSLSPLTKDVKNFFIISGRIMLEPMHYKAGTGTTAPVVRAGDNSSFGVLRSYIDVVESKYQLGSGHGCKCKGQFAYYQQMPWDSVLWNDTKKPVLSNTIYLSPPTQDRGIGTNYYDRRWTYNYSSTGGDITDKVDKIPILECELRVGDKYAVEFMDEKDVYGHPVFRWCTYENCPYYKDDNGNNTTEKRTTFTIGFNPSIGDFIIGKEYDITPTEDGRTMNKSGLAIPITYDDKLSGAVSFKIKCVLNPTWDTYVKGISNNPLHPTENINSSTLYFWPNVSAIWIKNFDFYLDSDNGDQYVNNNNSDVVYMSDEVDNYINKKDDIEFVLNTQLTNDESSQLGLSNAIAYSNVINLDTNLGLQSITSFEETSKAEKLYINQYWKLYNIPTPILDTQLHNNNYSIFNTFSFNGFGKMLPLQTESDLKYNTINIHLKKV